MLIYKSRVFDLYSTNLSSRRVPFEYVGHRGSVAALVLDPTNSVGLLAHHRPAIGRTLFELPAGTIDYESSLEDIMSRELKEEAGLTVEPKDLMRLSSLYTTPGYSSELMTLFVARIGKHQRDKAENLRWFTLIELARLIQSGEIIDMKTVCAASLYQMLGLGMGGGTNEGH